MNPYTSIHSPAIDTRLPRLEYSKDRFRNREDVLADIEARVRDMQQGKIVKQTVLLVWGVHGIGKSWILRRVAEEYQYQPPTKRRKGVFAALGSFEGFNPKEDRLDLLVGDLADQIVANLPEEFIQSSAELREFYKAVDTAEPGQSAEQVTSRFVALIDRLSYDYVPVLLFDSLETLEPEHVEFLNWFEEHVIAPVVRWNRTLVVLASRRELRQLRDFEVRRRVKKISLGAFPRKAVSQLVGSDTVSELLYPITYGHPLSTWYVQSRLEQAKEPSQEFTEEFLRSRQEELVGLLQDIVDGLLFVDVTNPAIKERLMIAATLRAFHIRSLQMILAAVQEKPELMQQPDSEVQRWIGEMTDTNLVRWSIQRSGYEVDFTVRHIINRLCSLQDDAEYIRRHREAFNVYCGWIKQMPSTSDRYVIEATYHLGVIVQVKPDQAVENRRQFQDLLDRAFSPQRDIDLEHADTLLQNVETDEELREVGGEFYEMLWQRLSTLRSKKLNHSEVREDSLLVPVT